MVNGLLVRYNQVQIDNGTDGEITCPAEGEAYHGQDSQYTNNTPDYTDNGDDTITDNRTVLMLAKRTKYSANSSVVICIWQPQSLWWLLSQQWFRWQRPHRQDLYAAVLWCDVSHAQPIASPIQLAVRSARHMSKKLRQIDARHGHKDRLPGNTHKTPRGKPRADQNHLWSPLRRPAQDFDRTSA